MREPSPSRPAGPPHNPDVRDLIRGKRHRSSPPDFKESKRGFRGWHERGYLPHRDEPGLTQFVTFHLADSFPESLRSEWKLLVMIEDDRERRKQLEAYLDLGKGECHLKRPEIAAVVEENFRQFGKAGERYRLLAWCIMPNHVHVLFKVGSAPMSEIVGGWKKHSARLANQMLEKSGAFWASDYFDTYIRDAEHERNAVHYIESNPTKAKRVIDPKDWPWSSARFRDEFGRLRSAAL